ncbi:porin [Prochlorococcus sp. AH-716-J09]|nr:porin [Prochlorococcus sp. AH-716-J09]
MKLFKSLLVAPATIGLLTPLSVFAGESNLNDISKYSNPEQIDFANAFVNDEPNHNPILAGGEGLVDTDSLDGGFSETTTASFSADMYLGAVDGGSVSTDDTTMAGYSFQIDLNTTFNGEDSLDISIDSGNAGSAGIAEFDGNSASTALTVDGVSYTFPIGAKTTAFVGDSTDGSLLFNTACVYSGPSNTLDDCGNNYSAINAGAGTAFGASYDVGNGLAFAFGYTGSSTGLMTKEGDDALATQVSYVADNYGVSLTYADKENPTFTQDVTEATVWGLNGYYTPSSEGVPSISVGFEFGDAEIPALTPTDTETSSWFVGLQWDEVGPGTAGVAVGTKQHTVDNSTLDPELLMYEAFYSYNVNDGMTITPLLFVKEFAGVTEDETGLMVKTSFSF